MSKYDRLYSFVFRGVLANQALDLAGRRRNTRYLEEEFIEIGKRLNIDSLDDSHVSNARYMSLAFISIHAFENSVRTFVKMILIENVGSNWQDKIGEKIKKTAETRKNQEESIRWHKQRGGEIIDYITFGDLSKIIASNWALFEAHLSDQSWSNTILGSIEKSRNVIMHSGLLDKEDLERLGANMRDWINQVGA